MSDPQYGMVIAKDVMVPMHDGVRLATDIYRPALNGEAVAGQFPTILLRTSYDKAAQRYVSTIADYFTPRGYVTVQQDLRGRYNSEDFGSYRHVANPLEGMDGYDTIEWIAAQPWSNGKVGMVGSSHPGLVQTHAALYRPPHLTAIWPDVAPTNSYQQQVRRGGAMQYHMFGALFLHAQDSQEAQANPLVREQVINAMMQMRELLYSAPFKRGLTPLSGVPGLEETLFNYYTRGAYDEYWSAEFNDFSRYFERHADIPGTFTGGWFDPYVEATTGQYAAMAKQNTTPQRLIIGPWVHMGIRTAGETCVANDVDFGADAVWGFGRFNAEQQRWYDHWLKGKDNGVEADPPIRIFVMGSGDGHRTAQGHLFHGGTWRTEQEWPLARTQYTTYYLHSDGSLDTTAPSADAAPLRYISDPHNPVPTIGGPVTGFFEMVLPSEQMDPFWIKYLPPWVLMRSVVPDGPAHQQEKPGLVGCKPPFLPLAARSDVLVFQSKPLAENLELTGPIELTLWISSSALDTDFTAKLIDVYPASVDYPEGYHMYLGDSVIRARYRNSFEREELLEPGELYQVTISLPPTSNIFKAGHRIRMDISSSNFPRFDINPNTGEPMGRHTHTVVAHNVVYTDSAHPSTVVFPVIPNGS